MNKRWIEPNDPKLLTAALRHDLGAFIVKVFATVSPGDRYLHNWHIDAIVYTLQQIHNGELKRLIVNQPPRSLKSICVSVAFVAWSLGHNPSMRFICVSYSNELAATFARQFRAVVTSEWYRALFPSVRVSKDTETEFITTQGGGRVAISVGGSLTGRGADVIIIDDPLKADEAQSDTARRAVNEWYSSTLLSRLDDKQSGAIVLVAQRLHEDDLTGRLLREGGWHHLNLPAIAEIDEDVKIGPRAIHRRRTGDVLHPAREPEDVLAQIKSGMGSMTFSAQYQQRPIPFEGSLVKRALLMWHDKPPSVSDGGAIVQSWDTASIVADTGDWSVCTTWLAVRRRYYLLDVWRGRLEFPQLKHKVAALARAYHPNCILVEQAGAGLHLIQEFRANPVPSVAIPIGIKPQGDKKMRMEAHCARFESRQIYLPCEAPWLSEYLDEILAFPYSRYNDQVDSTSQFLTWAEKHHCETHWAMIGATLKIFVGGKEWHPREND